MKNLDADNATPKVPAHRRTQRDDEAYLKARNVVRLVQVGYITPLEAWPWVALELSA